MAENKKSFLLYCDLIHTIEKMPDEKAGQLLKHILQYVNDKNPETDDLILNIAFEPIKQSLKRDLKKYENIRDRNIENIQKRWNAKNTTGINGIPDDTKNTVSVSVSDSVSDILLMKDFKIENCKLEMSTIGFKVMETALKLYNGYLKEYPHNKDLPLMTVSEWVKPVRNLMQNKKYTQAQIFEVAGFAMKDTKFWRTRILNTDKLENNFEQLKLQYHEQHA